MKTIEDLKEDKYLRPYILWYLKSSTLMSKAIWTMRESGGRIEYCQQVVNHERSIESLKSKLKGQVPECKREAIMSELCQYYMDTIGLDEITVQTPELLIFAPFNDN